jgi:hypothetical protein
MWMRYVVHSGPIMSSNDRTIGVGGRYIFLLRLRSLLLRILWLLLLVGLPVLRDGVRGVDVEGGRRVKMRSRSGRKGCYRVRELLVIKHNGICRGGGMHLLIERCRNVGVGMALKRRVLGRDRQAQSLSLSLRLRLCLRLSLGLDSGRRHRRLHRPHWLGRGCDIKRLTHKVFRSF